MGGNQSSKENDKDNQQIEENKPMTQEDMEKIRQIRIQRAEALERQSQQQETQSQQQNQQNSNQQQQQQQQAQQTQQQKNQYIQQQQQDIQRQQQQQQQINEQEQQALRQQQQQKQQQQEQERQKQLEEQKLKQERIQAKQQAEYEKLMQEQEQKLKQKQLSQQKQQSQQNQQQQQQPSELQNMNLEDVLKVIEGDKLDSEKTPEEQLDHFYTQTMQIDKLSHQKRKEIMPEGQNLLNDDNIEEVMTNVLTSSLLAIKLDFLLEIVHRCHKNGDKYPTQKEKLLELAYNFIVTTVLYPETLGIQVDITEDIFLLQTLAQNSLYTDFYNHIKKMNRYALEHFFNYVIQNYSDETNNLLFIIYKRAFNELQGASILKYDAFNSVLDLITKLLNSNPTVQINFFNSTLFYNPQLINARFVEEHTLIGRLMKLSAFFGESMLYQEQFFFKNVQQVNQGQKQIGQYQKLISDHNEKIYKILDSACKNKQSKECQQQIVRWMYQIVNLNKKATKSFRQSFANQISSNGFLFNFEQIMLRFSFNITEKTGLYQSRAEKLDFEELVKKEGFFEELDCVLQKRAENMENEDQQQDNEQEKIEEEQKQEPEQIQIKQLSTQQSSQGTNSFITSIIKITLAVLYMNNVMIEKYQQYLQQISQVQPRSPQEQPSAQYLAGLGQIFVFEIQMRIPEIMSKKYQFLSFISYLYLLSCAQISSKLITFKQQGK